MPRSLLDQLSPALKPLSAFLFLHLYFKANWKEAEWFDGIQRVTIKPGELITSEPKIKEQTGMTRQEIRTAIDHLVKMGFINHQTTNRYSKIHIVNYDSFKNGVLEMVENQPTNNQPTTVIEEGNKSKSHVKKVSKEDSRSKWFEELWKKYPRPVGKKEAHRHFLASVETMQDFEDIQWALECFAKEIKREGRPLEYVPHGKTWFNNWRDYIQTKPIPKTPKPPEPLPKPEDCVSPEEVQELVLKLAGGSRMSAK